MNLLTEVVKSIPINKQLCNIYTMEKTDNEFLNYLIPVE